VVRVKLERVENGVAMRTPEVVGKTDRLPQVGYRFLMTAPSLDPAEDHRLVCTSPVVEIPQTEISMTWWRITFRTENSTYRLTTIREE